MAGWEHADAHVEVFAAQGEFDSAVLAAAFLGDIHSRHDFEARKQRGQKAARWVIALNEDAIDAITDTDALGEWLDVDIGGAGVDTFLDEEVD